MTEVRNEKISALSATSSLDEKRKRFEAWAGRLGFNLTRNADDEDGEGLYHSRQTRRAWAVVERIVSTKAPHDPAILPPCTPSTPSVLPIPSSNSR